MKTTMKTWGAGPFDNDEAVRYVQSVVSCIKEKIEEFYAARVTSIYGLIAIHAYLALLAAIAEQSKIVNIDVNILSTWQERTRSILAADERQDLAAMHRAGLMKTFRRLMKASQRRGKP